MFKVFEQEQWELFNTPTKEVATKFWIYLGYECIENPDDYGVGLLVKGKKKSLRLRFNSAGTVQPLIFPHSTSAAVRGSL